MRIGIFTDSYIPNPTGVAVSAETIRQVLMEMGEEVFVFAPEFPGYKDKGENIYRFPSIFNPIRKDAPLTLPVLFPDYGFIKKLNLDIIHTQHFYVLGKLGLKAGKKFKIPVINTYHTFYPDYAAKYAPIFKGLARNLAIRSTKNYLNQCQGVIAPSPTIKRFLERLGIKTPIEVIPTGVDLDAYRSLPKNLVREKFNLPADALILIYVGRLGEEKNLLFLLKAFKKVAGEIPEAHLLLIGGGPEEKLYRDFVKKNGLGGKVVFAGFLPKKTVNQIYGASDVFVFSSLTDTQGLVIVEAMAAGLPVVAVNRLGPSDIVKDGQTGYLTNLNLEEFSDRIIYLLRNQNKRLYFGKAGRERAKFFSQENTTKHLLEFYERTISRP